MTVGAGGSEEKHTISVDFTLDQASLAAQMAKAQAMFDKMTGATHPMRVLVDDRAAVSGAAAAQAKLRKMTEPIQQVFELKDNVTEAARGMIERVKGLLAVPFTLPGLIAGGAGVEGFVRWPLDLAGNLETAQIRFESFLGSAGAAQQQLDLLEQSAAQSGYSFAGLRDASATLLQVGYSADQANRYLGAMQAAAARHGTGTAGVQGLADTFAFFGEQGFFGGRGVQEMVRSAGIPVYEIFAEKWKTSAFAAKQILLQSALPLKQGLDTITDWVTKHWPDAVQKQASTLPYLWERLKEQVIVKPFSTWGQGLATAIEPRLQGLLSWLSAQSEKSSGFFDSLRKFGESAANWALGPLDAFFTTLGNTITSPAFADAPDFLSKMGIVLQQVVGIDPRQFSESISSLADSLKNIGLVTGDVVTVAGALGKIALDSGGIQSTAAGMDNLSRGLSSLTGTPQAPGAASGGRSPLAWLVEAPISAAGHAIEFLGASVRVLGAALAVNIERLGMFKALIQGGIPGYERWVAEYQKNVATSPIDQEAIAARAAFVHAAGQGVYPGAPNISASAGGISPDQVAAMNPYSPIPQTAGMASVGSSPATGSGGGSWAPAQGAASGASSMPAGGGQEVPSTWVPTMTANASSSQAFLQSVQPFAQAMAQKTGLSAAFWASFAAHESAYGQSGGGESNVLFGVKWVPGSPYNYKYMDTSEYQNGHLVHLTAGQPGTAFEVYNTPAASMQGFLDFLGRNPRYAGALDYLKSHAGQPGVDQQFVQMLQQAGYATDPAFATGLNSMISGLQGQGYAAGGWISEPVMGVGLSSGRPYSFAERGREAVLTQDQMDSLSGGGGGGTYNEGDLHFSPTITVHVPDALSGDPERIAEHLADATMRALAKRVRRSRRAASLGSDYGWSTT